MRCAGFAWFVLVVDCCVGCCLRLRGFCCGLRFWVVITPSICLVWVEVLLALIVWYTVLRCLVLFVLVVLV